MFRLFMDGWTVYDPDLTSLGHVILSASLDVGVNKSGELTFVVPPTNPIYDNVNQLSSQVFVYSVKQNRLTSELMFAGRVLNVSIDFNKNKTVYCEGNLSRLVDSVLRPYSFTGSPNELFEYYIGKHNATVDPNNSRNKRFIIDTVSVDSGTQIEESSISYVSTLAEIQDKLLGKYGGYIVVGWDDEEDQPTISYLNDEEAKRQNSQIVQYSRNLMDLMEEQPGEDIYTVAIPVGAMLYDEESGESLGRVTIENYPSEGDPDYVEADSEYIERFGRIEKIFEFDYITTQEDLYTIAQYLVEYSAWIPSKISAKAIDLNLIDSTFPEIKVGDVLTVLSLPHNINRLMWCTAIQYDLFDPANTVYEFDAEETYIAGDSLTNRQNNTETKIRNIFNQTLNAVGKLAEQEFQEMRAESSAMIAQALGGYVYKTQSELFIMDTDDINTATRVWRWNSGGLGYWTGQAGHALDFNAQYIIAITANGQIVADVVRGELMESIVFNAEHGTIGGWSINDRSIYKIVSESNGPFVGTAIVGDARIGEVGGPVVGTATVGAAALGALGRTVYKVSLYPPSQNNPGTAKVLSFDVSHDFGATYSPNFFIRGDGTFTIYSDGSDGVESFVVRDKNNPSRHFTKTNANGFFAVSKDNGSGYFAKQSFLWASDLLFYDENGSICATYSGQGWREIVRTDSYSTTGETTWYYLRNASYVIAFAKREFSSVQVDHVWGNFYCGKGDGSNANFPALAFPIHFAEKPTCLVQLDSPRGSNDGWLMTHTANSASDPTWYSPAYDLARATSATVPSITLNYVVFGRDPGYLS